ncbi:MAG: flagellar filament capping protein FliD, partial [Pseudomonadota bacterium]|nr:flagellar filament capping protein FliD [Pseudomonadota bacterium]
LNGVAATGVGQSLIGAVGSPAEGLNVQVSGGNLGARGTVNYSQGYAYQLNNLMTSVLGSDGPIASRTNGINTSLNSIAKSKDELNAQLVQTEKRYRAQYTALDSIISKMSQTSSFLSQQLAKL